MSRLPVVFMAVMLGVTALARIVDIVFRNRTRRLLAALAASWQMHYVEVDRFKLAPRVSEHFPIPGGADMVVRDLIYSTEGDHYRYYFTTIYTRGVVRTKSRVVQAGTCRESRDNISPNPLLDLEIAPRTMALEEQYEHLRVAVLKRAAQESISG